MAKRDMDLETLRPIIGTVSHNRAFTPAEVTEYSTYPPHRRVDGTAVIRWLVRRGLVESTGERGKYYPTLAGWRWLDGEDTAS